MGGESLPRGAMTTDEGTGACIGIGDEGLSVFSRRRSRDERRSPMADAKLRIKVGALVSSDWGVRADLDLQSAFLRSWGHKKWDDLV